MKTKHTQGEWIMEKHEHTIYVCSGYKGFVIAEVTGDRIAHFIGNKQEAEANAKLIATAPELLDASQSVLESLNQMIYDDMIGGMMMVLKSAIKKATQ